ncbi:alpha/beta fold hydrolase [Marinobacter sp. JSM 1782161]|uniref:alpha/beta fold hydrolase n=1 Tax=Marinobacter sp. JSM 1782161 TaxID=2685906 RepID=UPI001403899B|nr:alpha/beta fold hydrolase [Marinobacter sp. JSM 1782161]
MRSGTRPLMLISGWGAPVSMIEPWVDGSTYDVTSVSLDTSSVGPSANVDELADRLMEGRDDRPLLVGWSLGGLVAMAMARRAPDRIRGVITVASTPCFVARDDWPTAMPPDTFDRFRQGLAQNAPRHWRRFLGLMVHGLADDKAARQSLRPWLDAGPQTDDVTLGQTLEWLADTDQRDDWANPVVPTRHLFGERDALVPPACASAFDGNGGQRISDMAHWPTGLALSRVAREIEEFDHEHARQ